MREDWVSVYTANSQQEAVIVQGRLQAENIEAVVYAAEGNNPYGDILSWGRVAVMVHRDNEQRAVEILNSEPIDETEDDE